VKRALLWFGLAAFVGLSGHIGSEVIVARIVADRVTCDGFTVDRTDGLTRIVLTQPEEQQVKVE